MICITKDKISVQQYQQVIKVTDKEIIFTHDNQLINILGVDLYISIFEKDKFEIHGKLLQIICNHA